MRKQARRFEDTRSLLVFYVFQRAVIYALARLPRHNSTRSPMQINAPQAFQKLKVTSMEARRKKKNENL